MQTPSGATFSSLALAASLSALRLISLIMVFLCLAPLGSLYSILISFGSFSSINSHVYIYDGTASNTKDYNVGTQKASTPANIRPVTSTAALADALKNPHASLEEIWAALLKDATVISRVQQQPHHHFVISHATTSNGGVPTNMINSSVQSPIGHHLTIALPWLLSFLFGVVVPTCVSILSFLHQRRLLRGRRDRGGGSGFFMMNHTYYNGYPEHTDDADKIQKRQRKMSKLLEPYSHVLTQADRYDDVDNVDFARSKAMSSRDYAHCSSSPANTSLTWKILVPGKKTTQSRPTNTKTPPRRFWLFSSSSRARAKTAPSQNDASPTAAAAAASSSSSPPPPPPSCPLIIAGNCAICLQPYELYQSVCWSANEACVHYFHQDCIASWLSRSSSTTTRASSKQHQACPCCRQSFMTGSSSSS